MSIESVDALKTYIQNGPFSTFTVAKKRSWQCNGIISQITFSNQANRIGHQWRKPDLRPVNVEKKKEFLRVTPSIDQKVNFEEDVDFSKMRCSAKDSKLTRLWHLTGCSRNLLNRSSLTRNSTSSNGQHDKANFRCWLDWQGLMTFLGFNYYWFVCYQINKQLIIDTQHFISVYTLSAYNVHSTNSN